MSSRPAAAATVSPRAGTKRARPAAAAAAAAASEGCAWSPAGDYFVIPDTAAFARTALAKHFKSAQFSSCVRQLHFYSFHKNQGTPNLPEGALAFRHDSFKRGRPELL